MEFKQEKKGSIVLSRDDWGNNLWGQVGETIRLLTHSGYQCRVRNDEPAFDIVVIDFNYDERLDWGDKIIMITHEQFERFLDMLNEDE